jgi:hypothetical protein
MISPAIAGNDSRCGIALHVFLGKLSAISSQYAYPIGELSVKRPYDNLDLQVAKNATQASHSDNRICRRDVPRPRT